MNKKQFITYTFLAFCEKQNRFEPEAVLLKPRRAREDKVLSNLKSSSATCAVARLLAFRQASRCATGKAKSKIQVCRLAGFFREGKSHFPRAKKDSLQILRPGISKKSQQNLVKAENPLGFQVSPKAKLPTAKSKILTRHRGVCLHSYNDTVNANAEVIIEHRFAAFQQIRGCKF